MGVVGQARERQDVVAAEIAYDRNAPMFLISMRTEKQVSGTVYHQCGQTWYRAAFEGNQLVYVTTAPPG
jgi:hypothetical protein